VKLNTLLKGRNKQKHGLCKRAFSSIKDTMAHKKVIALQSISGGYFDVNTT